MLDVAVIGAGVVGGLVARELTKYKLSVIPADKVELLVPAVVTLADDANLVNYFVFDFRHVRTLLFGLI